MSKEKTKLTKRAIFKTLSQLILFCLLIFTVFTFISSKSNIIESIRSMVVMSGSMEPVLPIGSVVYAQKKLGYDKGDIITFKDNSENFVTHRIVDFTYGENGTTYITKGDANNSSDTLRVSSANITGKIVFIIPFIGRLILFLNTLPGLLVFIFLPTLLVIGFELWNIKKEIEKNAEKRIMARFGGSLYPHTSLSEAGMFRRAEKARYFRLNGRRLK